MEYTGYFDGSITKNPHGDMTIGGLVYEVENGTRKLIYEFSDKLPATEFNYETSNNVAEALALSKLLSYFELENIFTDKISIFGDSRIVINRAYSNRAGHGMFAPYVEQVKEQMKMFHRLKIKWVPREQNTEADLLTK